MIHGLIVFNISKIFLIPQQGLFLSVVRLDRYLHEVFEWAKLSLAFGVILKMYITMLKGQSI